MGSLEARESLKAIAVGKQSSVYFLVAPHGGIRPAERRRSTAGRCGTRGDFQRQSRQIGTIDREFARPFALGSKPGNEVQWRKSCLTIFELNASLQAG